MIGTAIPPQILFSAKTLWLTCTHRPFLSIEVLLGVAITTCFVLQNRKLILTELFDLSWALLLVPYLLD